MPIARDNKLDVPLCNEFRRWKASVRYTIYECEANSMLQGDKNIETA